MLPHGTLSGKSMISSNIRAWILQRFCVSHLGQSRIRAATTAEYCCRACSRAKHRNTVCCTAEMVLMITAALQKLYCCTLLNTIIGYRQPHHHEIQEQDCPSVYLNLCHRCPCKDILMFLQQLGTY